MHEDNTLKELQDKINGLVEELVTVYEELNLFYDISEAMRSSLNLETMIDLILNEALDIMEADKAAILLLDEYGINLGIMKGLVHDSPQCIDPSYKVNIENSILGRVIHGKKGFIVNDLTECSNGLSHLLATKSLLCAPLNAKNKIIGALTLGDRRKDMGFTAKDLKLSAVLSSLAALTIENDRLLQHYLEKQRLDKELQIAQNIHKKLLPLDPPDWEGYDIAALSLPCIQIGGDYYDFIPMADGQWGIAVGDVMGHGLGAALLMATVRSALRILSEGTRKVDDILYRVNNMLIKDTRGSKCLMTLFYGNLNLKNRKLTFSNAGHDYPFVLRSSSLKFEFLESTGTVMGWFSNYSYKVAEIKLRPGDILFFYTDGAIEARGNTREPFGKERLLHAVRENRDLSARGLVDKVYKEVAAFCAPGLMEDDLLLAALKVNH